MYKVTASNGLEILESKAYKTAWRAVEGWLRISQKYSTMTELSASTIEEVIALREMVKENKKWYEEVSEKHDGYLKTEYVFNDVADPAKLDGCEFKYPDLPSYPCSPFTVG